MRLSIKGIIDRGVANKERVHLLVLTAADLSFYAVLETVEADPDAVEAGGKRIYWFPTRKVQPGDHIILYSRSGSESAVTRKDGKTNYFFYWGFDKTVWHDPRSRVALFELNTWETSN